MLVHPDILTDLLTRYESLRALFAEENASEARQRLEDTSYTLCVATGTRDIGSALTAARQHLASHTPSGRPDGRHLSCSEGADHGPLGGLGRAATDHHSCPTGAWHGESGQDQWPAVSGRHPAEPVV
ncbi:DUF5133 domain-containing protein [Streptomyces alfalfae]